jgi:hypothetical protein
MLLPCRPCCKALPADPCCTNGQLPETVTVTFEGPQGTKIQGPSLLGLAFSACYGSGAEGTATAPGGDTDSDWTPLTTGPISAVALTKAGSGYAQFGREAPTLTLANSSTTPGTVTISLSQHQDDCGIDYWSVASISVTGSEGYIDGDQLTLTAAEGDTVQQEATGIIKAAVPTLTASASPGTGATFTVTMKANNDPFSSTPMYGVASVGVSGSTSGYQDGSAVSFSAGDAVVHIGAVAVIRTIRVEPTISLSVLAFDGGAGASISPNLTKTTANDGRDAWTISSFTINNGGSGYVAYDFVEATVVDGQQTDGNVSFYVGSVDENGAITSVARELDYGGRYFKSSGTIERVEIRTILRGSEPITGGRYYLNNAFGFVIYNGGKYYRINESLPPYVAEVSVSVLQGWPGGGGSGAVITATVNDDAESADFGKIQSVQRVSGGNGYFGFLWQYSCDCDYVYGEPAGTDYSIVAYRNAPWGYFNRPGDHCSYTGYRCWSSSTSPLVGLIALQITSPMQRDSFEPFVSSPFPYVVAPAGKPGVHNGPITGFDQDLTGLVRYGAGFPFALPGRVQITPDKLYPGGHDITCTMTQQLAPDGVRPYWEVTSVTVTGGITGIANGDAVTLLVDEYEYGTEQMQFNDVSGYGENDAGPLPVRRVARGSAVVNSSGIMTGVTLTDRGVFYLRKHSSEVPALVSPVTATIFQAPPSQGSGAEFTVTVNADTASNGFGEIALNLVSGGDGYLSNANNEQLNVSVGGYDPVTVQYNGPNSPPTVTTPCAVPGSASANAVYTSDRLIPDCSDISFDAYFGESKISVAPGGDVTAIFDGRRRCCGRCDVCCPDNVSQLTVNFHRQASQGKSFPIDAYSYLGNDESFLGDITEDSWELNCPEDSAEIIFDIDDLYQEGDCSDFGPLTRSVSADNANSRWPLVAAPPQVCGGGEFGGDTREVAHAENSTASFSARLFGEGQCSGSVLINTSTLWYVANSLYVPSAQVEKSKSYVLSAVNGRAVGKCADFPGGFTLTESVAESVESDCLPGLNGSDDFGNRFITPGLQCWSRPEPGEYYEGYSGPWKFPYQGCVNQAPLVLRRVCQDYEVDVEIQ